MQEIIQQVGTLLLGSIPSLLLFVALVISYQLLVQGPLGRTLAERRARTIGAQEDAQKAIAAAEDKTAEHDLKLRQARAEVFRVREQRLKQWSLERESVMEKARQAADKRVMEARLGIETEADAARKTLLASADQLAEQVVRAVMPAAAGGSR